MRSVNHRIGSRKYRNGKSAKEKNQWRFSNWPQKKLIKGWCGSDKNNPEIPAETIADIWPVEKPNE